MTAKIDENGNGPAPSEQDVTTVNYRGVVLRVHRDPHRLFYKIKHGNFIVSRDMALPETIEGKIARAINQIKFCIDRGWGANVDYSKVQGVEE